MSVALTDNQTLLAFKAGRSFRRAGTNFVDADPTKGAIVLSNSDDGLLHFAWKERATGTLGEDLILFPGDAILEKVTQAPGGRTYVLRFESSDQRHFVSRLDPTQRILDKDLVLDAGDATRCARDDDGGSDGPFRMLRLVGTPNSYTISINCSRIQGSFLSGRPSPRHPPRRPVHLLRRHPPRRM